MIIIITGSVGTGKTTLAKKLASLLNHQYIDVNKLIEQNKIYEKYDRRYKAYIVDIKKLNTFLGDYIKNFKKLLKNNKIKKKGMIIDSHMSHYLPKRYVDACVVTKCDLKKLQKRLKKRNYNQKKINENLEAEIFDVCFEEAIQKGYKPIIVDTSKKMNVNKIANIINKI